MTCPEYAKQWLDAITGDEKFVMVSVAGLINAVFFACRILSEPGYLTILGFTVGAYITGKVIEDRSNANMAKA